MSTPGHVPFIEARTSAQAEKPGLIKVNSDWFRRFTSRNPASIVPGWAEIHPNGRKHRAKCYFAYGLKDDVIEKISKLDSDGIKRLIHLVTGFEDNFMFSDPERFPLLYHTVEYRKFFKWLISTDVYRPGQATKEWKVFVTYVKWRAVRSRTDPPPIPKSFPGFPRFMVKEIKFPTFWNALCPWLYTIWERGLENKFQATRLAHLLTSRNLPSGTKRDRMETLLKHASVLCDEPGPELPMRGQFLFELAYQAGKSIRGDTPISLKDAHVSLTTSASIDSPVNKGGRATGVRQKFREWLMYIPSTTEKRNTWFQRPYWLEAGVPRWRTMCRDSIATDGRPGDSADIEEIDFTPGKFKYEDPLYCLDKYTGYQLFQWSIEAGIAEGVIVGTPYHSTTGLKLDLPCRIRASAIGEPGGKSRVVTVGEDWLTIFLQPLAHVLIGQLRKDPSARAGLSRAWQGFEYIKAWSTKDSSKLPDPEERFIITSDLTTATDYCPHLYSKSLLSGFLAGLQLTGALSDLWVDLLTAPRLYEGPSIQYAGRLTMRGVLMGDPGSKVVLSLFNKAAEMEAILRYNLGFPKRPSLKFLIQKVREGEIRNTRFRLFAFAGDDHIGIGPEPYLREITRSHIRNGMKVSTSSNFISNIAGFYCEEILFINSPDIWKCWGLKTPLSKQPYGENPHVDALKIRLFSLCQKEHEGKNETNPAIGMSSSLRGMIAWFAEGWESIRQISSWRFAQKMRRLLPSNLMLRGLPRSLGGVEAPVFGYTKEQFREAWEEIPWQIRKSIALVLEQEGPEVQALRRILSKVSSCSTARGVSSSDIEERVRADLSMELCETKPIDELKPDHISDLEWANLRLFDKFREISKLGSYIPIGEALQVIMRPYIFRDLLFPEESIAHGIDPNRKNIYRQIPWPKRLNCLEKAIDDTIDANSDLKDRYLSVTPMQMQAVRESIIDSLDEPYLKSVPKEVLLVPRRVVFTDKLCTLSTPDIAVLP